MHTNVPAARSVLAVCAHPDDESFGLGAILANLRLTGSMVSVLCFTHGEASTLHGDELDLARVRKAELEAAAIVLDLNQPELLAYPDGRLAQVPLVELATHVARVASNVGADLLLVFDKGGITGHPDHCRATEAARACARDRNLPVLAWTLPLKVAEALNAEFGAAFVGREMDALNIVLEVDRSVQQQAIRCHASQSSANPVLWRRLELLGEYEWLRLLDPGRYQEDS